MNPLTRWNLLNGLEELQQNLRSLFSCSCGCWPEQHLKAPRWIPLVAVSETTRGYVLVAELPQVKQQDVKIGLQDGVMTITGDRKFEQNRKQDHRVEQANGSFAHRFVLPADARPAKLSAAFNKGVLIVHLAKHDVDRWRRAEGTGSLSCTMREIHGFSRPMHQARCFKNQIANKNGSENENKKAVIPTHQAHPG